MRGLFIQITRFGPLGSGRVCRVSGNSAYPPPTVLVRLGSPRSTCIEGRAAARWALFDVRPVV